METGRLVARQNFLAYRFGRFGQGGVAGAGIVDRVGAALRG